MKTKVLDQRFRYPKGRLSAENAQKWFDAVFEKYADCFRIENITRRTVVSELGIHDGIINFVRSG